MGSVKGKHVAKRKKTAPKVGPVDLSSLVTSGTRLLAKLEKDLPLPGRLSDGNTVRVGRTKRKAAKKGSAYVDFKGRNALAVRRKAERALRAALAAMAALNGRVDWYHPDGS